jgi:hypothetical protein
MASVGSLQSGHAEDGAFPLRLLPEAPKHRL